jgi:hypothetical protein
MLNRTKLISAFAFLSMLLALPLRAEENFDDEEIRYSDCHIHLLNFLQGGEFQNDDKKFPGSRWGEVDHQRFLPLPAGQRWRRISGLLYAMDRDHIDYAMICGMPVLKKWADNETFERPDGYLDNESHVLLASDTDLAIAAAVHEYQQEFASDDEKLKKLSRVAPFVCGFDPTDLGAVDQVVARIQEYPGVWQGIGEIMSRHDDLTHLQLGERPRSNHPAMLRVCKFAGENFLPVSLHHNIAPVSRPGTTKPPVYLDELIELFRYCHVEPGSPSQSTVFIWCHAGASRRVKVENLPYWIDEVLASFGDHVYIDLSWVVWENYIAEDIPTWVKLIEKYPTRFMLGSDVVGGSSTAGKTIRQFEPLLEELDEETRAIVARDNYVQLMKRMADLRRTAKLCEKDCPGITLPVDYRYPEYADMPRLRDDESFVRSRLKREGK